MVPLEGVEDSVVLRAFRDVANDLPWGQLRVGGPADIPIELGEVHAHSDVGCVFLWNDHNWVKPWSSSSDLLNDALS